MKVTSFFLQQKIFQKIFCALKFLKGIFWSQKLQTNLCPQKLEISDPSKLHFEVLGVGKTQEVSDKKLNNYSANFSIDSKTQTRVSITTTHPAAIVITSGIHLTDSVPSTIPKPTASETKTPTIYKATFIVIVIGPTFFTILPPYYYRQRFL